MISSSFFVSSLIFAYFIKNPVKLSVFLILLSSSLFFYVYNVLSLVWFSLLFFLLFVGGIMVIFMIVSSLFPNEGLGNFKFNNFFFFLFFFFFFFFFCGYEDILMGNKSFFVSGFNLLFFFLIIVLYFFVFCFFVDYDKSSLRSFFCSFFLIL